jgi:CubicO group peptidase (beta-lactamase class C family)/membrane protease YdiL (CAAX protease family)
MQSFLKRHSLVIGLVLMFLYTWTIDLSNSGVLPFEVPFSIYITLGWGFIFVSLLMTWLTLGKDEAVALFKRFFLWRVGWKWFWAAFLLEPVCIVAGVYLNAALTGIPPDFSAAMAYQIFGASASPLIFFPVFFLFDLITNGEEMGWRGYVLPRLQAKHSALTASLILGVIWAFWHLPKYVTHFNVVAFGWAVIHFLAFAVILTWLYNNTKGSLLIVAVCHAMSNTVGVFMPMANTVSSENIGSYIFYVLFEVLAAIVIIVVAGTAHLSRTEEKQVQGVTMRSKNQPTILSKGSILALLAVLVFSPAAPVAAGEDATGQKMLVSPNQAQGPTDAAEIEAFLDELFARHMEENHIAGAVVAVVKDGALFFAKGYGYADLENKVPVDAEKTIFKLGSITKLFTWTAVMQLVEQGKLDLDADINTYLDFRIADTYSQPITLKHLMAHTSGFEDLHADMVKLEAVNLTPPRAWLISHIPARVRPPGEVAAYSNYNAALAGYIVARVSGQAYSAYVQEHILGPLGMNDTTAYLQTPPELRGRESVGYMYDNDAYQIFPQLLSHEDLFPAGIMRSTATNMARFMIIHLQGGFYGDAATEIRILEEATARQMQSVLYAPDPRILGNAYGFFEFNDNGQRVIGHSGSGEPMESMLLLLPDENLGVFVAYNSLGAGELNRQHFGFQRAFFDHYYSAPALEPIQPPADFAERADHFMGAYKWTMSSYTTFEKYFALMGPTIYVKNPGDGTLLLESPFGDWRIVEEEPMYFRFVDNSYHIAFREDEQGRIVYLFTDLTPMMSFEKVQWYETLGFNMPLLMISLLMFLFMLLVALVRFIQERRRGAGQKPFSPSARIAARLIVGISVLNLLFIIGSVMWGEQIVFGIPFAYKIVLGLGVLSAVLTVGALIYIVLAWKDSYWGIAFRVYYTLVTLTAVAFIWFLNQWNLLGWRY